MEDGLNFEDGLSFHTFWNFPGRNMETGLKLGMGVI